MYRAAAAASCSAIRRLMSDWMPARTFVVCATSRCTFAAFAAITALWWAASVWLTSST